MTALTTWPTQQLQPHDPWIKHPKGNFQASWILPQQNDLPQSTASHITKMLALAHMAVHAGSSTFALIASIHTPSPAALTRQPAMYECIPGRESLNAYAIFDC